MDDAARGDMTMEELLELGGLKESSLSKIIRESRKLLGLQTFYTVGPTGKQPDVDSSLSLSIQL